MSTVKDKIGIISTRLGGLDGVSLEVDKWVRVLKKAGFKIYFCVGEKGRETLDAKVIPSLSVDDEENKNIINNFFEESVSPRFLRGKIDHEAEKIEKEITEWLKKYKIKKIIVENISALPIHVPAAVAIDNVLKKNPDIIALFHHHDFHWERRSYFGGCKKIKMYLKKYFPPKRRNSVHVVINSIAQENLLKKYGIKSIVIPNVFDRFTAAKDKYNSTLRRDIGLEKSDLFFAVPVRIVPRKNIEAAIELVKRIKNPKVKLVIAGCVDPYDLQSRVYFEKIQKLSAGMKDRIKFVCGQVAPKRQCLGNQKVYSLFDIYAQADFVLYPTLYEGWGNAFGEAMAFGVPTLVNRYEIFKRDIEPFGFEVVKISNGRLKKSTVKEVAEILKDKSLKKHITEHNKEVIKKYFGPDILLEKLQPFINKK
jgi:glycosyltransferase involved in cell wall biosynthesis